VAVVHAANPPVNALNERALDELATLAEHLSRRDEVAGVVFTGDGGAFVAGADVRQLLEEVHTVADAQPLPNAAHLAFRTIEGMDKPCVAAINGVALGGGLEFALACHYRMAEPTAVCGFPEIRLRLLPATAGTQRLPAPARRPRGRRGMEAASRCCSAAHGHADERTRSASSTRSCGERRRAVARRRARAGARDRTADAPRRSPRVRRTPRAAPAWAEPGDAAFCRRTTRRGSRASSRRPIRPAARAARARARRGATGWDAGSTRAPARGATLSPRRSSIRRVEGVASATSSRSAVRRSRPRRRAPRPDRRGGRGRAGRRGRVAPGRARRSGPA
jgi:acrylyl-CoA reductase (NADPH)/3-hydroxypropionyl-CoA dehydratase/3-hydroxypropionyl-CoA synthetase